MKHLDNTDLFISNIRDLLHVTLDFNHYEVIHILCPYSHTLMKTMTKQDFYRSLISL